MSDNVCDSKRLQYLNLLLNVIVCLVIVVCGIFYLIGETKNDNEPRNDQMATIVSNMTEMREELKSHIATTEAFMSSVNEQLGSISKLSKTINSLQESADTLHSSVGKNAQMIERLNETMTKVVNQIRDSMETTEALLAEMNKAANDIMENNTATMLSISRMNADLTQQSISTIVDVNHSLVDHIQRVDARVQNGTKMVLQLHEETYSIASRVGQVNESVNDLRESIESLLLPLNITELLDYQEENAIVFQGLQDKLTQLNISLNSIESRNNKTLRQIKVAVEEIQETLVQLLSLQRNTSVVNQTYTSIIHQKEIQIVPNNCSCTSNDVDHDLKAMVNNTYETAVRIEDKLQQLDNDNNPASEEFSFWSMVIAAILGTIIGIIFMGTCICMGRYIYVYTGILRKQQIWKGQATRLNESTTTESMLDEEMAAFSTNKISDDEKEEEPSESTKMVESAT